jgi:hypothetical protein
MYISSKFKCKLRFNWHLILVEGCATQSWISSYNGCNWIIRCQFSNPLRHGFLMCFTVIVNLYKIGLYMSHYPLKKQYYTIIVFWWGYIGNFTTWKWGTKGDKYLPKKQHTFPQSIYIVTIKFSNNVCLLSWNVLF